MLLFDFEIGIKYFLQYNFSENKHDLLEGIILQEGFKITIRLMKGEWNQNELKSLIKYVLFLQSLMLAHQRNQLIDTIIKNIQEPNSQNTHSEQQKEAQKSKIVLKKLNTRLFKNYQSLTNPSPFSSVIPSSHHVYKLFNTFGINQTALTTPDFEQSFLRTYFYHRSVTKVERYHNAVVISIIPINEIIDQPALTYLIQKFKSYGNVELLQLANLIQEIWSSLLELKNQKMSAIIQEDKESVTKYLNQLGKSMFYCKFGLYKIALSNSLLEYLGYDVDQFCIETIKYRTVLFDFMSSNVYNRIVTHALTTLKVLMQVDLNKATMAEYLKSSKLDFTDYIYSKDNKKTYCDIEFTIPVRGIICIKMVKLHYQSNELSWKPYCTSYNLQKECKKKINQKEYELLNKIGVIPSNWLSISSSKVAGYRQKKQSQQTSKQKSQ